MTTLNAMLIPAAERATTPSRLVGRYMRLLGIVLLGYALLGKGFAYVGVPPLFIGELALALGLLAAMTANHRAVLRQLSIAWPLLLFMGWGALRTIPYIGVYGIDALRDGVVWGYGVFALIVMILVADHLPRLLQLLRMYRWMVPLLLLLGPVLATVERQFGESIPTWPWSDTAIVDLKGGDLLVHVTGAFAYLALVGTASVPLLARAAWMATPLIALILAMHMTGRAGMLSFATGAGLVALLRPYSGLAMRFALLSLMGVLVLWTTGFKVEIRNESPRNVSFEQLADNVLSIVSDSNRSELSGSKGWRIQWWTDIANYTFNGPYFWTGKGYGINLATADGYQVSEEESLRSPHNGHMTMLARGGVPGLSFWVLVQGFWIISMLRAFRLSRRAGQAQWSKLFAFLIVYWAAFMANTAFDVFIEGPMGGIWLWVLYGVGLAAIEARRRSPELLGGDDRAPVSQAGASY